MKSIGPTSEPDPHIPYAAWRAPDVAPDFRAAVWNRIEARRAHPVAWWAHIWLQSRVAYAGALLATAMLWAVVAGISPSTASRGQLFNAIEPGTLTAAFAQVLQGK